MPEQEHVRLTATVRGRVHGVGYRIFVIEQAAARGLRGFARNDRSGTVEVVAEGPRSQLEGLLEELRRGPIAAHVTEVETVWGPATGEFVGFRVRY
jgi:acylphosphatase